MTRNGPTRPLPKKLTSTPSWRIQTMRGSRGLNKDSRPANTELQHTLHATYVATGTGRVYHHEALHFVTREHVHVDRIATVWAIRRFVDRDATFEFVPRTRDVSKLDGIPFDIRGAELGHRDGRCTFESLLEKYELRDAALRRMAAIIRGADLPHEEGCARVSPGGLAVVGGISECD